jgi:hypothetical protein
MTFYCIQHTNPYSKKEILESVSDCIWTVTMTKKKKKNNNNNNNNDNKSDDNDDEKEIIRIEQYETSNLLAACHGKLDCNDSLHDDNENDGDDEKSTTKAPRVHNFDLDIIQQQQKQEENNSSPPITLTWIQASWLITAECLGTGILALPASVRALSHGWMYLMVQIPIHTLAGILLCHTANQIDSNNSSTDTPSSLPSNSTHVDDFIGNHDNNNDHNNNKKQSSIPNTTIQIYNKTTRDYVGLSIALFGSWKTSRITTIVTMVYYANLFLVLGNYNLVMSHAMVAFLGDIGGGGEEEVEDEEPFGFLLCLPLVGLFSTILGVLILLPFRSMAHFGRSVSYISLLALAIVVIQCLVAQQSSHSTKSMDPSHLDPGNRMVLSLPKLISQSSSQFPRNLSFQEITTTTTTTLVRTPWFTTHQLSAMASVAYAVSSQKLLLNVRHVMTKRQEATKSLFVAVSSYVMLYLLVCILAGSSTYDVYISWMTLVNFMFSTITFFAYFVLFCFETNMINLHSRTQPDFSSISSLFFLHNLFLFSNYNL